MKINFSYKLLFCFLLLHLISCRDPEAPKDMFTDNFDRGAMLQDWADHLIIPAFQNYIFQLEQLHSAKNAFINNQSLSNLTNLRNRYIDSYKTWQTVALFNIGQAESIGLTNYSNVYPTDTLLIKENISEQEYNLELPSNFDAQGFPALDFLLYGLSHDDNQILSTLSQPQYLNYLSDLIERLLEISDGVLNDWSDNYRDIFINNDGSSGTASVDKLVNDFLFYYERYLRAGKIGLPAGVFTGNPMAHLVEAPYSEIYSKELYLSAFNAVQNFFRGNDFNGQGNFLSLEDYLNHIAEENNSEDIADKILDQWSLVLLASAELDNNLKNQVIQDNSIMLSTYDELQKAVIILKVDMMQALNIQIDYIDADGD